MPTATATRQPKTYPRLTREATDPATPPARLAYLSSHHAPAVKRLALANPALPAARLTEALRLGLPAAWGNPAALFALLTMPPAEAQKGAVRAATELARCRTRTAATEPPYVVTEAMAAALRPQLLAAWEDCDHDEVFINRVAAYAQMCGPMSPQHHAATLLYCLRIRAADPRLVAPAMVDEAEAFAWSGTTDRNRLSAMFDLAMKGPRWNAVWFAASASPSTEYAMGMVRAAPVPGVAALLRAAMPVPMWLAEADPSHG